MKAWATQTVCVALGAWLLLLATQIVDGQLNARDDIHAKYPVKGVTSSVEETTVIEETTPMETPTQTEMPPPEVTPMETPTDMEVPPPEDTAYPIGTATEETPEDYETYEEATPSTMPEFVSRILEAMDNYGGNDGGGGHVPPATEDGATGTPMYTTEAMYTRVTVPAYRLTRTTEATITEGVPEPEGTPAETGGTYNMGRTQEVTESETTITTTVPGGETPTSTTTNTSGVAGIAALPFQAVGLVAAVVAWLHTD